MRGFLAVDDSTGFWVGVAGAVTGIIGVAAPFIINWMKARHEVRSSEFGEVIKQHKDLLALAEGHINTRDKEIRELRKAMDDLEVEHRKEVDESKRREYECNLRLEKLLVRIERHEEMMKQAGIPFRSIVMDQGSTEYRALSAPKDTPAGGDL